MNRYGNNHVQDFWCLSPDNYSFCVCFPSQFQSIDIIDKPNKRRKTRRFVVMDLLGCFIKASVHDLMSIAHCIVHTQNVIYEVV